MSNKKVFTVAATILMGASLAAPAFAATPSGSSELNGNGTPLPQSADTEVGISFGNGNTTGNSGYLFLNRVPQILDFGNHNQLSIANPKFDATGKNLGITGNNQHASYDMTEDNKTTVKNNTAEFNAGKVYTEVVDNQTQRQDSEFTTANPNVEGTYDKKAGSWTLSVQGNGQLTASNGKKLTGTKITFNNGSIKMYDALVATGEAGALAGTAPTLTATPIVVDMDLAAAGKQVVEMAKADEGAGLTETAWSPSDIILNVPGDKNTEIADATYMGKLTWTLSSDAVI